MKPKLTAICREAALGISQLVAHLVRVRYASFAGLQASCVEITLEDTKRLSIAALLKIIQNEISDVIIYLFCIDQVAIVI
jgi:hypothetical protein